MNNPNNPLCFFFLVRSTFISSVLPFPIVRYVMFGPPAFPSTPVILSLSPLLPSSPHPIPSFILWNEELKKRGNVVWKFVRISQEWLGLPNYNSLLGVILKHTPITHLTSAPA